jgi:hypothetical protein
MQPQNDEGPFEWIRLGRDQLADSREPNWAGNFVSHLMPPVFEAYAKVLHRIEVRLENIDTPLSPDVTSNLRIPASKDLRLFVESRRANSQGSRIRWRELAELLNVPFVPEIGHQWYVKNLWQWGWPRFLRGRRAAWAGGVQAASFSSEAVHRKGRVLLSLLPDTADPHKQTYTLLWLSGRT